MKKFIVYVYTKAGNKKRYHLELENPDNLFKEDFFVGQCYETKMHFAISSGDIDIIEFKEVEK